MGLPAGPRPCAPHGTTQGIASAGPRRAQGRWKPLPDQSVEDNLILGAYVHGGLKRPEAKRNLERSLTPFPRLREGLQQPAGSMSGSEQQMLAIARGPMTEPDLLVSTNSPSASHGVEGPSTDKPSDDIFAQHRLYRELGMSHWEWMMNLEALVGQGV